MFPPGSGAGPLPFILLGVIMLLVAGAAILLLGEARQQDIADRVRQLSRDGQADPAEPRASDLLLGRIRRIGNFLQTHTGLFSEKELATFEQSLAMAGLNPRRNLPLLLGAKAVMTLLVPLLSYFIACLLGVKPFTMLVMVAIGLVIGLRGAFIVVRALRRPFLNAIRRGLPDAFDLLVICTEAGLGFETALDRVAGVMRRTNVPTAFQLARLAEELRLMPDQSKALANFGRNSAVEGMQRFTAILSQSLQFGTPLAQALRLVAAELRRQRANRLEANASRLPVLLIFPLLFFIMPCIMIVMAGPSVITLFHTLQQMNTGFK